MTRHLTLYHKNKPFDEILVDATLYDVLSRVRWLRGDGRRPQSPRTILRVDGEPRAMSLNRVVYALDARMEWLAYDIFGTDARLFLKHYADVPHLQFADDNVLNCTRDNLCLRRANARTNVSSPSDRTLSGRKRTEPHGYLPSRNELDRLFNKQASNDSDATLANVLDSIDGRTNARTNDKQTRKE